MVDEQIADRFAGAFVDEGPFGAVLAQVDELLQGVPGVLVKGNDPLFVGFAPGQPQPRSPVEVVVQAVQRQMPDLVPASSRTSGRPAVPPAGTGR